MAPGGEFKRVDTEFRDTISTCSNGRFPAEKGRYTLIVALGCPWAHRTIIVRHLKGLQDVIGIRVSDGMQQPGGWHFPDDVSAKIGGKRFVKEFYEQSDSNYKGRPSVPVLWDEKQQTIVNNESADLIRVLYDKFDAFLPEENREDTKGEAGLYPPHLREQIDEMNEWVYNDINNGVYKCGFTTDQNSYSKNVHALFKALDRMEAHLSSPDHQPFVFGKHITEADIRLYTTIARFDVAYHTIFKCNLKMIRHDYPNIDKWYRGLYHDEGQATNGGAFKAMTDFREYKEGYARAVAGRSGAKEWTVPEGPVPDILPL